MEGEVWKKIEGSEIHLISNLGHVKNVKGKYLIPWLCNGYAKIGVYFNGRQQEKRIHRLVAEHFLELVEGKDYVNHKDGNQLNNRADNLEWVTASENMIHYYNEVGGRPQKVKLYFTKEGEKDMEFESIEECAKFFGKARATIWGYSKNGRAYGWNIRREEK